MIENVVIGAGGEVGECICNFLEVQHKDEVFKVDIKFAETPDSIQPPNKTNIMHVCIPYSENFKTIIDKYKSQFFPNYIIIYSTVLPGTTSAIGENAVHSPIEGRHPNLLTSFMSFDRLLSGNKAEQLKHFFINRGLRTKTFPFPEITELGKLLSSVRYGLNLTFADVEQKICNRKGLDFNDVVIEYQKMYNKGFSAIAQSRFIQSILTPPNKVIGGHCVIPNARLLKNIYDNSLIDIVANYNLPPMEFEELVKEPENPELKTEEVKNEQPKVIKRKRGRPRKSK